MKRPDAFELKGNYVSYNIIENLLYISGQLCVGPDGNLPEFYKGKLGSKITDADGYAAARLCLLQVLAHTRLALGWLDPITKCALGCAASSTRSRISSPRVLR